MYYTHTQMCVCVKIYIYIQKNIHQKKHVYKRDVI